MDGYHGYREIVFTHLSIIAVVDLLCGKSTVYLPLKNNY